MKKLHKGFKNNGSTVESKEGERRPLCSNKAIVRSPSLEFRSNSPLVTEKMQLDYLASLIVDIFLEQKRNANKQQKTGSDLLQGID